MSVLSLPPIVDAARYYRAAPEVVAKGLALGFKLVPGFEVASVDAIKAALYGGDEEETERIRAAIKAAKDDPDAPERTILYSPSNEERDRDGDRIMVASYDLKNYRANPVILFNHQRGALTAGKSLKIWKEPSGGPNDGKRLRSIALFPDEDTYPFAYSVYKMVKAGFMPAVSVGFIPREYKADPELSEEERRSKYPWGGMLHTKTELLEYSPVPIPSLPSALAEAKAAGINLAPYNTVLEAALDSDADPLAKSFLMFADRGHLTKCWSAFHEARSYVVPDTGRADDDSDEDDVNDDTETPGRAIDTSAKSGASGGASGSVSPAEALAAAALLAESAEKALEVLSAVEVAVNGEKSRILSMLRKGQDVLAEAEDRALGDEDTRSLDDEGDDDLDDDDRDTDPDQNPSNLLDFSQLVGGQ